MQTRGSSSGLRTLTYDWLGVQNECGAIVSVHDKVLFNFEQHASGRQCRRD